jgi:hypothetical protein
MNFQGFLKIKDVSRLSLNFKASVAEELDGI